MTCKTLEINRVLKQCDQRGHVGGETLQRQGHLRSNRMVRSSQTWEGRENKSKQRESKQRHLRGARGPSVCLDCNEQGVERGQSRVVFAIWGFQSP